VALLAAFSNSRHFCCSAVNCRSVLPQISGNNMWSVADLIWKFHDSYAAVLITLTNEQSYKQTNRDTQAIKNKTRQLTFSCIASCTVYTSAAHSGGLMASTPCFKLLQELLKLLQILKTEIAKMVSYCTPMIKMFWATPSGLCCSVAVC